MHIWFQNVVGFQKFMNAHTVNISIGEFVFQLHCTCILCRAATIYRMSLCRYVMT